MEKIKILYVDDELNNRVSFKANFRLKYNITLCESGEEGLKKLNTIPPVKYDIVIADQKMPNMTGVEFLNSIDIKDQPVKIVVTAHRDNYLLEAAKDIGQIFDYYDKPWNVGHLEMIIESAVALVLKNRKGNK